MELAGKYVAPGCAYLVRFAPVLSPKPRGTRCVLSVRNAVPPPTPALIAARLMCPKGRRAEWDITKDPARSNYAIAKDLGCDEGTVKAERKRKATAESSAVGALAVTARCARSPSESQ